MPSSFRLTPALHLRGVVAPNVSLYLGLPGFELPFRKNLSEGSILFNEYFSFLTLMFSVSQPKGSAACRYVRFRIVPMGRVPLAGEIAQEFELPDSTQAPRRLSELISHGPLVLLFYRGNW